MRLIDADAVVEQINRKANSGQWSEVVVYGMAKALYLVKNAPTVTIPVAELDTTNDMAYNRFIDVVHEKMETKYDAGVVYEYGKEYIVAYEQKGAEESFSVGQPVYDEEGNVMGYLGIGMYDSLNYANDIDEKTPVEHWTICLPTRFCVSGKKIYTYYQNCERKEGDENG